VLQRCRRAFEPRADEMAGLLEELIARDTENPPGRRLSECGQLLSDAMARLGFAPELLEVPPIAALEDPCVVRGMAGDGTRTVYFHGHFDVVPAQSLAQFRPQRRDGKISGRGAADLKGGLKGSRFESGRRLPVVQNSEPSALSDAG
jgi:succinyl-diaminopimelate desuccinylase